jgi:hypothetical protein
MQKLPPPMKCPNCGHDLAELFVMPKEPFPVPLIPIQPNLFACTHCPIGQNRFEVVDSALSPVKLVPYRGSQEKFFDDPA